MENHLKYQFMIKRFCRKEPFDKILRKVHIEKSIFYRGEEEILHIVVDLTIQNKLAKI